jgi:ribonuclease T1
MNAMIKRIGPIALVIAAVLIGQLVMSQGGDDGDGSATPVVVDVAAETDFEPISELPTIDPADLPPEAIDTITLIDAGGPYPFDRDDLVFENREGLLPDRDLGHYREYTVITPGESTRGARRVVAGDDGELYYTADHYRSFREVSLNLLAG